MRPQIQMAMQLAYINVYHSFSSPQNPDIAIVPRLKAYMTFRNVSCIEHKHRHIARFSTIRHCDHSWVVHRLTLSLQLLVGPIIREDVAGRTGQNAGPKWVAHFGPAVLGQVSLGRSG